MMLPLKAEGTVSVSHSELWRPRTYVSYAHRYDFALPRGAVNEPLEDRRTTCCVKSAIYASSIRDIHKHLHEIWPDLGVYSVSRSIGPGHFQAICDYVHGDNLFRRLIEHLQSHLQYSQEMTKCPHKTSVFGDRDDDATSICTDRDLIYCSTRQAPSSKIMAFAT